MAMNGAQVLLLVETAPNVFTAVGEQTGLSIEQSVNLIEAGTKADSHQKYIGGRMEGSLSLEALYVPSDAAFGALKNAFKNRQVIKVRKSEGATIYQADALVETISEEYPDDDVATVSVDLKLNTEFSIV